LRVKSQVKWKNRCWLG